MPNENHQPDQPLTFGCNYELGPGSEANECLECHGKGWNEGLDQLPERGDGMVWAPADGAQMLLERAASMLTGYSELIRRDGASHVEEHHYLPEVEHVAAELRAMAQAREQCAEGIEAVERYCGWVMREGTINEQGVALLVLRLLKA